MRETYDALRLDVGRRPWPDAVVTTPSSVQVDEYTLVRRDEPFVTATPGRIVLHRHETAGLGRAVPINYYLRDGITVQVGDRTGDPYHLRVRGAGAMWWDPRIGSVVITENGQGERIVTLTLVRWDPRIGSVFITENGQGERMVPVRHVPADEPVTGEEEATSDGQDPLLSGEAAETHSKPDSEEKVTVPEEEAWAAMCSDPTDPALAERDEALTDMEGRPPAPPGPARDGYQQEVERLRAALTAESERSTTFHDIAADNGRKYDRLTAALDERDATIARVQALADKWRYDEMPDPTSAGDDLHAALWQDPTDPPRLRDRLARAERQRDEALARAAAAALHAQAHGCDPQVCQDALEDPVQIEDVDERLLYVLRRLGDDFGALGVARAARNLVQNDALVDRAQESPPPVDGSST